MNSEKNFKYSTPHLMEAMERTKHLEWHLDEWASDVVNAAVEAGYARRPSVTQCQWSEEGVELFNSFKYRELNNGVTAVYIGESDFGNDMFNFYDAKISEWEDVGANKDKKQKGTFIMVDNVLHSTTKDLEPSSPLSDLYQVKKEDARIIIYDPETKSAEETTMDKVADRKYNIAVIDLENKTSHKMKDREGIYSVPNNIENIEGSNSSKDSLILYIGKTNKNKTEDLDKNISVKDIEVISSRYQDYKNGNDFFQARDGISVDVEKFLKDLEKNKIKDKMIEERSPNVFELAPLILSVKQLVGDAISEETGMANLSHYQYPFVHSEIARLSRQQENHLLESGDIFISLNIFGVNYTPDKTKVLEEGVEEYIKEIKESDFYQFFVKNVSNHADKNRLMSDPFFHDFQNKYKDLESIQKATEKEKLKITSSPEMEKLEDPPSEINIDLKLN